MRKMILISVLYMSSGCAWFQKLLSDPVAAMAEGAGYFRTALSLAQSAYGLFSQADPNAGAQSHAQFEQLVGDVNAELLKAQDKLREAAAKQETAPDTRALLAPSRMAIGRVNAFLSGLPSTGPGGAANPLMRDALEATENASR